MSRVDETADSAIPGTAAFGARPGQPASGPRAAGDAAVACIAQAAAPGRDRRCRPTRRADLDEGPEVLAEAAASVSA